ncbi:hypothetical protein GIB67_009452 [Kingdonia uniflora]|uniref:Uncharacterized protein n=1 Tax=Kingdonia uniflora TaxID=39325 RepID=A0A7J7N367_9MAGN|nr:hypothetical protein GIB67_009452 [Kingdonia uniflora]
METTSPREHIEEIRRKKFSIGAREPNTLTEDLHQAVKNLSAELYAKDVHFLMELIQNAEDNEYSEGIKPSLEFVLTSEDITATGAKSTLLVFNNEKGFFKKNIESICSVGIGFKSVFLITAQPYIFSNGYQIRFSEEPALDCNVGYIVPEWVQTPTLSNIQHIYGDGKSLSATTIILPLKPDKVAPVKQQLSSVHPELLLFLSKIKQLNVREENTNPKLNSKFPVKVDNRVKSRDDIDEWAITLAFPNGQRLKRGMSSPGVYAYLPTDMVTNFLFIIQADFILSSSRETILLDNKWNEGILNCVSSAFFNALHSLVKTTEATPVSCLPRMFEFLPVKSSSYPQLNVVRESIKEKVKADNIIPLDSEFEEKGVLSQGKFLSCIKEGRWLQTSVGYRSPSESFLSSSEWGSLLQMGCVMVVIPLIDQAFYGNKVNYYKKELRTLGVMTEFSEACRFIGKHLMTLSASSKLTKANVLSILNFIKLLREKYMSPEDFITTVKEGKWLKTSHGFMSPLGSILHGSEWVAASKISNLPFIDQQYHGEEILSFKQELQLLGVIVGFNQNYQLVSKNICLPADLTSITAESVLLILQCIKHSRLPDAVLCDLKSRQWLVMTLGYKSPTETFVFNPEWGSLLNVFSNCFPILNESFYGSKILSHKEELQKVGIIVTYIEVSLIFASCFKKLVSSASLSRENVFSLMDCYRYLNEGAYRFPVELIQCIMEEKWCKHELKDFGVNVEFKEGSKFVAAGLNIPQNVSAITPASVLCLLECIRNSRRENINSLPDEFMNGVNKKWVKTSMGYNSPDKCLLFTSEWSSYLQCEDGPFIDEEFYSSNISSYKEELNAIGVISDPMNGCVLLANNLDCDQEINIISRIYKYLSKFNWEVKDETRKWIWIPKGSDNGKWVSPDECVLHDKDNLFGLQLYVLDKHYNKQLLNFFSMTLGVRLPSIDDYLKYVGKHWTAKTEKRLGDSLVKVATKTVSDEIMLFDKQDVFIPDELQLKDLFENVSSNPIFVWYSHLNLPSVPRKKLNEIYKGIGVPTISESVCKVDISSSDAMKFDEANPNQTLISKGMIELILGFLADPSLSIDAEERGKTVKGLLNLTVFETKEPITVSYNLLLSSGENLNVKMCRMVYWNREHSKMFTQKMDRLSARKANVEYATYFSEVISEGLLWERAELIPALSELIKLGWLLEFDKDSIEFVMKNKNLQLFAEDEYFLKSAFSSV